VLKTQICLIRLALLTQYSSGEKIENRMGPGCSVKGRGKTCSCFSCRNLCERGNLGVPVVDVRIILIIQVSSKRFGQLFCPSSTSWVHYTTSCNTQSSVPEDGKNNCPKHVDLTGIINNPLLLHLVGCLYIIYINDARSGKHQIMKYIC
jgi:hypothetical protein